jgi:hypothetical protein
LREESVFAGTDFKVVRLSRPTEDPARVDFTLGTHLEAEP